MPENDANCKECWHATTVNPQVGFILFNNSGVHLFLDHENADQCRDNENFVACRVFLTFQPLPTTVWLLLKWSKVVVRRAQPEILVKCRLVHRKFVKVFFPNFQNVYWSYLHAM